MGVRGISAVYVATLIFVLLYEGLMVGLGGATLGKMAARTRVVDASSGGPIGIGRAFVRQLIPLAGYAVCGVGAVLVYLSVLFDKSGRLCGWHDNAANDLVVRPGWAGRR